MSSAPYRYSASIDDHRPSAQTLAGLATELFHPRSVVDFGCGLGNFVLAFRELGVPDVLGVDGIWARKDPLFRIEAGDQFQEADLSRPISLPRSFDLALCLEVAEHLPGAAADTLVHNLTEAAPLILFSAAPPGQGGIHHVNEQWIDYWMEKFGRRDFVVRDVLRPLVWDDERIQWWYRQNLYLVHRRDHPVSFPARPFPTRVLHPGILQSKNSELYKLLDGKESMSTYLRLLVRALRWRFTRRSKAPTR